LEYRKDYDVIELLKVFPADNPKPTIFATCGTEDDLREENLRFVEEMKKTDFDFTYEEWTGDHEWYFFSDALKRTLDFWNNTREK
jgi:S-formylglutathione hydrolase FrmB